MSGRGAIRLVAISALVAVGAACAPAPPPVEPLHRTIPDSWGASLLPHLLDVAYGPHEANRLDVYRATSAPPRGTIVYVHGGGWSGGSKDERDEIPRSLLHQTTRGYDVVAINYRLAGVAPFPAAALDVAAAVEWVLVDGPGVGLDTRRVVLSGWSAGGHLATLVAVAANDDTPLGELPRVDGVVSLAGIHEFEQPHFPTVAGWLAPGQRPAASPARWLDPDDPPVFTVHGIDDGIVPIAQQRFLEQQAHDVGAGVTAIEVGDARLPATCRNHRVSCGVPADQLDSFLDGLS